MDALVSSVEVAFSSEIADRSEIISMRPFLASARDVTLPEMFHDVSFTLPTLTDICSMSDLVESS